MLERLAADGDEVLRGADDGDGARVEEAFEVVAHCRQTRAGGRKSRNHSRARVSRKAEVERRKYLPPPPLLRSTRLAPSQVACTDPSSGRRRVRLLLIHPRELLQPPPEARLAGVEAALRVGAEVVEVAELSRLAAVPRKAAEELAVGPRQDAQGPALAVGDDDVALPGIGREDEIGHVGSRQPRAD